MTPTKPEDKKRQLRLEKLESATSAIARIQGDLKTIDKLSKRRSELASHLHGFYWEIDKLAKGKAMIEVTPLMLEQANDIIRDAKEVVSDDTYLDRIKEFVPAGNNPVYPDVLVVMRGVKDCLERSKRQPDERRKHYEYLLSEATTIATALRLNIEEGNDPVLLKEVVDQIEGSVAEAWFIEGEDGNYAFDFEDLDARDLDTYLSRSADNDTSDDDDDDDDEIEVEDSDEEEES